MINAISLIHNRMLSMKLRHKHIKSGLHTLPDLSSSCVPECQRKSNFAQVGIKFDLMEAIPMCLETNKIG
jgi:hypothetical protein